MQARDRRALAYLGVALVLSGIYRFWPADTGVEQIQATPESVDVAEQRLARLRDIAATIPAKQEIVTQVTSELAIREQGLIKAETGPQAQAQLIQILRRLGTDEAPAVEIRATQLGALAPLDDFYGAANVTVQLTCRIEQLINFLAAISAQPELIVTQNLQITSANASDKNVQVRLTVAGIVPHDLVAEPEAGI